MLDSKDTKIAFVKISNDPMEFEITKDDLKFIGTLSKKSDDLVLCVAKIVGFMEHICDSCGKEMALKVDESLTLLLSDGLYKDKEHKVEDVVEFFDGFINLDELFTSEIESYKSDYIYCDSCKNL